MYYVIVIVFDSSKRREAKRWKERMKFKGTRILSSQRSQECTGLPLIERSTALQDEKPISPYVKNDFHITYICRFQHPYQ